MSTQPFRVSVLQSTLDDLSARIARTRWPGTVTGAGWDYGADLDYLQSLLAYWGDGYDWRAQEAKINAFSHVVSEVDGITIHAIHERGKGPNPIPVLVLHGWPSSFVQMLPILPLLTDPASHGGDAADSFDVVVASLPGYGFSGQPAERGMGVVRIAELLHTFMTRDMGYSRFGARGSDLGAGVINPMALDHPESLIGLHLSGTNPYIGQVPDDLSTEEETFVANAQDWTMSEMAYAMEHSSKPQTLAFGLNDSPAGLAAWVIEKFRTWSDCGGDLDSRFSRDDLLSNLTVYWATQTIGSSMRLYYETVREQGRWGIPTVPTAMLMSPKDMFPTPRAWAERSQNIVRWTEIPAGGHFLEWEEPEAVAADMREFFRQFR